MRPVLSTFIQHNNGSWIKESPMKETWKDIIGYEGVYQVSNFGRVKSLDRDEYVSSFSHGRIREGRVLTQIKSRGGYMLVHLSKDGVAKTASVHRLVAKAFIPNPMKKTTVNHIDGNKANNISDNLEWATMSENISHAFKTGLKKPTGGVPSKPILCVETGKVYDSTWDVARAFNKTSQAGLYWALENKDHTAWGFHWRYY